MKPFNARFLHPAEGSRSEAGNSPPRLLLKRGRVSCHLFLYILTILLLTQSSGKSLGTGKNGQNARCCLDQAALVQVFLTHIYEKDGI